MATHSSVLAWRIPGMGEPGGCRRTGCRRTGTWGRTESDMTDATWQQQHLMYTTQGVGNNYTHVNLSPSSRP